EASTLPRRGCRPSSRTPTAQNLEHAACRSHALGQLFQCGLLRVRFGVTAFALRFRHVARLAVDPEMSELRSEGFHVTPRPLSTAVFTGLFHSKACAMY